MKRNICIIISLLALLITTVVGILPEFAFATTLQGAFSDEEKIYCSATIDDEFVDDVITVVLTRKATLSLKEYTVKDFAEIGAESVKEITKNTKDMIKSLSTEEEKSAIKLTAFSSYREFKEYMPKSEDTLKQRQYKSYVTLRTRIQENSLINFDNYKTILSIKLKQESKENVLNAIKLLEKRHDVYSAEPKYIAKVTKNSTVEGEVSNETNYFDKQWSHDKTNLQQALNLASKFNQEEVKIGVIDSGIDVNHPELMGIVDTTLSKNYASDGICALQDFDGHGTSVASVIKTNAINLKGILNGENFKLVSLRILSTTPNEDDIYIDLSNLLDIIDYASVNNIEVLNMSYGDFNGGDYTALSNKLQSYTGVFVVAAGNKASVNVQMSGIPKKYHLPSYYAITHNNVISVSALAEKDETVAYYSNIGDTTVFAPGGETLNCPIIVAYPNAKCETNECVYEGIHVNNGYHLTEGTSVAAPYVSAVAALIKSINKQIKAKEIKEIIKYSADDFKINKTFNVFFNGNWQEEEIETEGKILNSYRAISSVALVMKDNAVVGLHEDAAIDISYLPITEKFNDIAINSIANSAFENCHQLTKVTFGESINLLEIGDWAFYNCNKLMNIVLPATLEKIGNYSFSKCIGLTTIEIPEGVKTLGDGVFDECYNLAEIKLSYYGALESIGAYAFYDCKSLKLIAIPNKVTEIKSSTFYGCTSLSTFYYTVNPQIQSIGSYAFAYCKSLKGITIPISVTEMGSYVFKGSGIMRLEIPEKVEKINGNSFANCPDLEQIVSDNNDNFYDISGVLFGAGDELLCYPQGKSSTLYTVPSGITKIGDYAFNGCSTLTSITIPNSVKYIGFSAFENCTGLTSINIPSSVTEIDAYAFYGCSSLANITIANGVESIGSYAFYGTGLTSISIPSSVESIGEEAFGGNYLTEINVQLGNSNYYSEEGVLFGNGGVLIVYPIGKEGVYIVPDGTTEIGNYAFYGCYQLKGIVIPSSVTKINDYAFVGCDQLEEFIFAEGSALEYIGYEAFAGCWALEEITIPSSVTYVGALAFATWEEHQKIVVQADVSVLEQWDVDWAVDCFAEIEWDGYNLVATEGLGYILTDNGYEVEVGSSLEHSNGVVIIPAEYEGYPVIGVADNGFAGRSELIKVIFAGNNLIRIGTNAFGDCHNLIAINIPDGVTEIGDNAFYACHQLQNVRLPRTVERIGDSVFAECHNLKSVTVPGGVVYVEASALEGAVGYTIYTEIGSDPSEWYFLNNNPECAIFYNCMLSEDGTYVVFIVIQEENYINADPSAPYRDGYVLLGWTTVYGGDVEYTMQEVADGAIGYGTVLYAVWQREV